MLHIFEVWSAQILTNELNLIFSVSSWKERFSLQHLSKDASNTPHVNRGSIMVCAEKKLRSSIPSCSDIFCEDICLKVMK